MKVSEIKVGKRFRKDLGDLSALCASIERVGLLHAVVVTPDGELVAGVRRLAAFKKLGRDVIPTRTVASLSDAVMLLTAERDENTCRKDFSPTEAVALGEKLESLERPKAKARQGTRTDKHPGKLPESSKGDTRDRVAPHVGMSPRTYEKAKRVVEAAKEKPELFGDLPQRMDETGNVDKAFKEIKEREKAKLAAEIRSAPPPSKDEGPFDVLVVDPPWQYEKRAADTTHRGRNPYPTMMVDEICAYEIHASDDAILWLWTTNAFMRDAYRVLDAWGFQEKTILTWVKDKMGVGDWLRGKTEHCILAVRGRPLVTLTNQTTALHAPLREHSRKPDEFFALVDALCPSRNRAEHFQREPREGWVGFGAEVGVF